MELGLEQPIITKSPGGRGFKKLAYIVESYRRATKFVCQASKPKGMGLLRWAICKEEKTKMLKQQHNTVILVVIKSYYACRATPKLVTSVHDPSPVLPVIAPARHSFPRSVAAVANLWQHCVRLD